ncbi:heterogeneous nuclear ribonucleo A3-like [Paramuricea clavata]|nr:heterogeneous nuclear ribonucleo A3-like [Paramuricea clavata]
MRHSDTGKPRGFGFVTYEKVESVDAVLTVKSHILDDKKIDPKRAVAREQPSHSTKQEDEKNRENQRVFVGGLASATTEDDVRECFTKFCYEVGYGRVQDIEIMRNREDGKCRGFCFVTFHSDTDIVDRVCAEKYFEIINKAVEVRRAESRLAMMERKGRGQDIDRRRMADRRRDANYSYQGPQSMRGNNFGSAMQGTMSGGFGGGNEGGFDGFNMNAMALAGMMNMFASYMGMNMGNMGGAMGNSCMNQMGNMGGAMGNTGSNQMSGHNRGVGDLATTNSGGQKPYNHPGGNVYTGNPTTNDGSVGGGAQNSSTYNQQAASSMVDMSGYANTMGAMFGVDPTNVQAALYSAYAAGNNQLGVYNYQSPSAYGPARNTSTGNSASTSQGYKPY